MSGTVSFRGRGSGAGDHGDHGGSMFRWNVARSSALGIEHLGVRGPRRRPQAGHVGAPRQLLQPVRQPDGAFVRASRRRTRGGRGVTRLRIGHGGDRVDVFALCSSGSHIVTQTQLYAGTLAFLQGPCARFGHRRHLRRRRRAGCVRRGRRARTHDARDRRDAVEPVPRAGRPRRARLDQGSVHARRLDVRHAARPAAARPRRSTSRCIPPPRESPATTTPPSA